MSKGAKITVAGAGALGLTTALALADAGAQVTVFDPAPAADNASGVAAGMLAPAFEAVLDAAATPHFDLLLAARDLWPALEARIGIVVDRAGALATGSGARKAPGVTAGMLRRRSGSRCCSLRGARGRRLVRLSGALRITFSPACCAPLAW